MRYIIAIVLTALLVLLQAKLWWGDESSVVAVQSLNAQLDELKTANEHMRANNEQLQAEIRDLREGTEILEDQARSELGMIKPNEVLILLR